MIGLAQDGHDDDRRHPRDGLRPQGRRPGRVHGRRRRSSRRPPPRSSSPTRESTAPRTSSARSSPTDAAGPRRTPRTTSQHRHTRRNTQMKLRRTTIAATAVVRRGSASPPAAAAAARAAAPAGAPGQDRHQVRPARPRPEGGRRSTPASTSTSPSTSPRSSATRTSDIQFVEAPSAAARDADLHRPGQLHRRHLLDHRRRARRRSPSPARTSSPARTCWSAADDDRRSPARTTLTGKKLCSVTGSTSAQKVKDKYPGVQLQEYDTYSKCVEALNAKVVDALTTDNTILAGYAGQPAYKGKLKRRRQDVLRGEVRHRPEEGRHRACAPRSTTRSRR